MTTATFTNRPSRTRPIHPGRRIHRHHAFPACLPASLRKPLDKLTTEQLNDVMEIAELERKGWGHPRTVAALNATPVAAPAPEDEYEEEGDELSDIDDEEGYDFGAGILDRGAPSSAAEAADGWIDFNMPADDEVCDPTKVDLCLAELMVVRGADLGGEAGGA